MVVLWRFLNVFLAKIKHGGVDVKSTRRASIAEAVETDMARYTLTVLRCYEAYVVPLLV
eukprot:XP_001705518.1 Hypothetical protein GL50803_114215 [Giardia lamblia ATCC 50803]